eukprot:CAMPEP_0177653594 /NCGR_PEP_ID=MMETSP0447-20121125/13827_1 /TAXON_ID=0 /ORGANISM="Stygamoeba regulata, Strain BSH-02190019" /LENGTH=229 /DNA_ID=CAMNT_0019157077 /DNA_START=26 /DNA_END=711 /DNA_ORIENTATION=-
MDVVMNVFVVCKDTNPGDCVHVVGDFNSWNTNAGVQCNTNPELFPLWSAEIPASMFTQYKYIIKKSDGQVVWEPITGNRLLTTPSAMSTYDMFGMTRSEVCNNPALKHWLSSLIQRHNPAMASRGRRPHPPHLTYTPAPHCGVLGKATLNSMPHQHRQMYATFSRSPSPTARLSSSARSRTPSPCLVRVTSNPNVNLKGILRNTAAAGGSDSGSGNGSGSHGRSGSSGG